MVADGGESPDRSEAEPVDGSEAEPVDGSEAEPVDGSEAEPAGTSDEPRADDETNGEPTDEEIVATASDAAEGVVFSRYRRSDVRDVDVAVSFEDGVLEVDVYLNVPDADVEEHVDEEAERVADDAALAAIDAVDRLFESQDG